ncbi:hypothetical protein UlMin_000191 [Ulmus minor]
MAAMFEAFEAMTREENRKQRALREFKKSKPDMFHGQMNPVLAGRWLDNLVLEFNLQDIPQEYYTFKQLFHEYYIPIAYTKLKPKEFYRLKQGDMTVMEYHVKFTELSKYAPGAVANQLEKIAKFEEGLRPKIREACASNIFTDFLECLQVAMKKEAELDRSLGNYKSKIARGDSRKITQKQQGQCGQPGHLRRNCP